ncbi:MAG: hypothetical protein U9Q33_10040 [Campylobacterota bacterium]|nr:hypothetical protein [Campylobacterota bacterium]
MVYLNSDIFLSNEILVLLTVETVVLILQFISFYFVIKLLKNWDFSSTSSFQYALEKRSYLVTLLIYFTLFTKTVLYGYFVFTLDTLSNIVPGAMCAAGVLSSNEYGEPLFILKSVVLFLSSFWILFNNMDIKEKIFPYFRKKMCLYVIIFIFLISEFILNILYFSNISTRSLVTCCSAIYSKTGSGALPFDISVETLLILFFTFYIVLVISNKKKIAVLSALFSILFLYISYYAVIYFFGTYIYELPTHHCPFCMLQSDYYHIGYVIFISLFVGVFFGVVNMLMKYLTSKEISKYYQYSNISITFFVIICSFYVILYYLRNGVLL